MLKLSESKIQVSWWDMQDLIKDLAKKIPFEVPLADSIYGIPRGGLIPAVILSHRLQMPLVETIGRNTLVIDDICDSGETLDKLVKKYQTLYSFPFNLNTAVLHYKPHTSCFEPTLYAEKWNKDVWLVYPWEKEDSKTIQDYKLKLGELN